MKLLSTVYNFHQPTKSQRMRKHAQVTRSHSPSTRLLERWGMFVHNMLSATGESSEAFVSHSVPFYGINVNDTTNQTVMG